MLHKRYAGGGCEIFTQYVVDIKYSDLCIYVKKLTLSIVLFSAI